MNVGKILRNDLYFFLSLMRGFRSLGHTFDRAKISRNYPLHANYSSRQQLYESCNTARAAGRPAKMPLEAHSGHDSSKLIDFVNLPNMRFRGVLDENS